MLIGIAKKLIASFEGPVRRAVPVIITADPEKHLPVMKNNPISFPDAHIAVINVIGFSATAIEFKNEEILSLLQVFDRSGLDIITTVKEFIGIMTQLIKYFQQVLIDLFVQVGKMCAAVMVTR